MTITNNLPTELDFIQKIIKNNGPDFEDYAIIEKWFLALNKGFETGKFLPEDLVKFRESFGEVFLTPHSNQGFVYCKPRGYAGDFEIIDKIYTRHISYKIAFKKWDKWFHSTEAVEAVRNRKTYFKNLLKSKLPKNKPLRVLNLASGPCRDLLEFFEENPSADVQIDCIELDKDAIEYAIRLLGKHISKVNFINKNIFRFQTETTYDLVWSAGLFDYFDDKTFVRILTRFLKNIERDGELVIGNFHPRNPARAYMEFAEWFLNHRTETELVDLAVAAGVSDYSRIRVEQEPLGVNLFMRILH